MEYIMLVNYICSYYLKYKYYFIWGDIFMGWWDKFKLRQFENMDIANNKVDDIHNRFKNEKIIISDNPIKYIIIGLISILLCLFIPNILRNGSMNNIIKLILSGVLLFSVFSSLGLPYGIYKLFKR